MAMSRHNWERNAGIEFVDSVFITCIRLWEITFQRELRGYICNFQMNTTKMAVAPQILSQAGMHLQFRENRRDN